MPPLHQLNCSRLQSDGVPPTSIGCTAVRQPTPSWCGYAPVAQGKEHRFPKPCAKVRILPGAQCDVSRGERGDLPESDTEPPRTEGPGGTGDRHRRTGAGTAEAGERPPETPDGGTGRDGAEAGALGGGRGAKCRGATHRVTARRD